MKGKRIISSIISAAMCMSLFANFAIGVRAENTYKADFGTLVKDSADAMYGTSQDKNIVLDEYTTLDLSYEGTYVSADGKVYLYGGNNGKGAYNNGSYIEFIAPADGMVNFTLDYANYYIDGIYKGYSSTSVDMTAGQKLQIGERANGRSYVSALSFTYNNETPGVETEQPTESASDGSSYASPGTVWDFNSKAPASAAAVNMPYLTGKAIFTSGEIQFPADATGEGAVTLDLSPAVKGDVEIEFDTAGHSKALGQQYEYFTVTNSEGDEIVSLAAHPYDATGSYAGVNKLLICGEQVAVDTEIASLFGAKETHIKLTIDYTARKVTATIGGKTFSGSIPAKTMKDLAQFKFRVSRNKTAGDRYISFDNLSVREFTSTETPAVDESLAEYISAVYGGVTSRVKAPSGATGKPIVIFLSSSSRFGTDNEQQLYQAEEFFDLFEDEAVLAAPQTAEAWDADTLKAYIEGIKAEYNSDSVTVIGNIEGAAAAYALAKDNAVNKIIPISGYNSEITATNAKVWAFGGYNDENIANIRTTVNTLQKAKADVTYTELPYDGRTIADKAAAANGIKDWILSEQTQSKTVDLVIFMGQSNMAGRGEYDEAIPCLPGHGYEYHPVTEPGTLTTVSEPFGKYENNTAVNDNGGSGVDRRSGDMVSSFMESYYAVSGVPIVGVQCSRGGTESKWWYQTTDTTNNLTPKAEAVLRYNEAKQYLTDCGYTINKQLMVWCQGEADADANRGVSAWKSNTLKLFNDMKAETGLTDLMIVRIGHCKTAGAAAIDEIKDPRYKEINLAGSELADDNTDITAVASFYTDEYAELMRDQYHYHQGAYNSVGQTAGNNAAVTMYSKGTWSEYPEPDDDTDEPVVVDGIFEKTASAAEIDISDMKTYGADTFRVYKADKSYVDVKAENGKVTNPTGSDEVTVVPIYRFNYTNSAMDGYVTATGTFTAETGYGLVDGQSYSTNENGSLPKDAATLHVVLPEGSYDMNILRKGGTRSDVYNDGIQIINNTTAAEGGNNHRGSAYGLMYAPQVRIADGSADITIGNTSGSNERIAAMEIVRVPDKYKKPIIWIAGDSESASYFPIDANGDDLDSRELKITGFGMQLAKFLSDKYKVANWGQPGATVKTWYDECFDAVKYRMSEGDTILVDFGINDAISSSNKISVDDMKAYMTDIFNAAKAKNVTPILVSPLWNSKYQHRTYFTYDKANNTNAMYDFAQSAGVACIDLNKYSQLYKDKAIEETGDVDWVKNNYHVYDNLHQTQHTALLLASFIAAGMKEIGYETSDFEYTYTDAASLTDDYIRAADSENQRIYSVAAAEEFMKNGTIVKPSQAVPDGITVNGSTVTVTLADKESAMLIRATFDDNGRFVSAKTYELTFENGKAEVEIPELTEGDELYVWDSLDNMEPLMNKWTVKNGTDTPVPSPLETEVPADPATTPAATPTAEPTSPPTYTQDFESYAAGDNGGWTSPAGTMAVKSDTTDGIGKYQTVVSGKSGTCRSGYIELPTAVDQNFVFECDFRSTSKVNVSDLELVEAKGSIYANHGVYSNARYAFIMARPVSSDLYVINNQTDDSGLTLDRYTQPAVVTKEITGDPWLHVKVVGNFDTHTVIAYITSLDGKTEYYHGMTDMSPDISSWKCIHLLSPSTGADTCIDNIVVRAATKTELSPQYHMVKLSLGTYSFEQYVLDGESVVNIPSTETYGDSFDGWSIGGKVVTTDTLSKTPIRNDCEITGKINDSYIEALSSVGFKDFPAGNELAMGADENTYGDNMISLSITGEQGTSLVTDPDERVEDYKIEWSFDGFRTLDGAPTGETGAKYCDSYGLVEITEAAQSVVNFKLKKTAANYYGRVKARVTYNGKTIEIERPLVLLGDKSGTAILPRSGYTADFNKYESTMTDYRIENGNTAVDGWETSGSDGTYMDLRSDAAGKYLSISRAATGNSSFVSNSIGDITSQTVFKQDIRFTSGMTGSVEYGVGAKGVNTDISASRAFQLSFDGSKLSLNGAKVCDASAGTWYHVEITADPTTKKCFAKVYNMNGTLLGSSEVMDFGTYTSGMFYHITLGTRAANRSIDINNVTVYKTEIDADTIEITGADTVQIPDNGTQTVKLSASAKTTDGDSAIGAVEWSIDDELAEGVSISPDGTLTITSDAASGDLPVRATIGGKSAVKTIKLTGTRNNIAFTEAPLGIQLGAAGEYRYTAELRNGNAEKIDGAVTYSLANADGNAAAYTGVSINAETGKLTVTSSAAPQTIYVKATSGDYSKLAKTVLYSLKFSFGTTAQNGYTQVTSAASYSDSKGFGIEGAATDEASAITGSGVTFKVKLQKGRVYSVKAEYQGTICCERVNSDFPGFDRTKESLSEDTYNVAIFGDDVMDITLPSGGRLASVEIIPVEKTAAAKPDWWTIGDSTVQQNGSWGYTIAATDLSKYPELAAKVNSFHNSGQAGRQHRNYYTEGLLNNVLTRLNPGDVVSISGMGTNDSSSSRAQFKAYDEMYVNAILDMGAYVILGSYTPTGNYGETQGKVYDADTMTFKGMRTKAYDLAIRELYEEYKDNDHVLGFLDIGRIADEKMTADVKAAYDAASGDESAKRAAANARAEEMMAWWKDYNHYYTDFSNYILPEITKAVAELIMSK